MTIPAISSELSFKQEQKNTFYTSQGFLPLAMTDAALFQSLLCGSALHLDMFTGKKRSTEMFKHMKEAVSLLSTRLREPGEEIGDGTIAAVAHLADFEVSVFSCEGVRG